MLGAKVRFGLQLYVKLSEDKTKFRPVAVIRTGNFFNNEPLLATTRLTKSKESDSNQMLVYVLKFFHKSSTRA